MKYLEFIVAFVGSLVLHLVFNVPFADIVLSMIMFILIEIKSDMGRNDGAK